MRGPSTKKNDGAEKTMMMMILTLKSCLEEEILTVGIVTEPEPNKRKGKKKILHAIYGPHSGRYSKNCFEKSTKRKRIAYLG